MAALAEKTLNKSTSQHLSPATRPSKSLSMEDTTSPRARAGSWDSVSTASGGFLPEIKSKPASIKETSSRRLTVVIFGATGDLAKKSSIPRSINSCYWANSREATRFESWALGGEPWNSKASSRNSAPTSKKTVGYPSRNLRLDYSSTAAAPTTRRPGFESLAVLLDELEQGLPTDRLFFLSVPPTVFGACAQHVSLLARPGTETMDEINNREALRERFRFFCRIRCLYVDRGPKTSCSASTII